MSKEESTHHHNTPSLHGYELRHWSEHESPALLPPASTAAATQPLVSRPDTGPGASASTLSISDLHQLTQMNNPGSVGYGLQKGGETYAIFSV